MMRNAMKKIFIFLSLVLFLAACFAGTLEVHAAADTSGRKYVIDGADILTAKQEEKLEKMCRKVSKDCELDIVIITMNKNLDYSPMDNYLRSILETEYGYFGHGRNCEAVVYGIDMSSRADRIVTSGRARSNISQSALDGIRERAEEELADGDYYAGCKKYIRGIERKLSKNIWFKLTDYIVIKLGIAFVVTLVAMLIMMTSAKSKMTVSSTEYTRDHRFRINGQQDNFINTTVVKRHIERSSSGGGGGGGGGNSGSSGGHF